jgi:hypothetical protein
MMTRMKRKVLNVPAVAMLALGGALAGIPAAYAGNGYLSDYNSYRTSGGSGGRYLSGYSRNFGTTGRNGNYLSDYNNSGFRVRGGYSGGYIRDFSGTSFGGFIVRKHDAEYNRLRKLKVLELKRRAEQNTNPPCGTYGRLPASCKRAEFNISPRD